MYRTEKNTAEKPVRTREAKTWKSPVNAITWRVHSRLGNLLLEVPLPWSTENDSLRGDRYAIGANLTLTDE
jgi:hypothetical protein